MQAQHGKLHQLFDTNFLEYTSYVIRERAIPAIEDGLKPVQRRILQTLYNMDDGRFHKVANVVGETMKLHPHGDQSIFSALVNLANKGFLIERQGNFGNILTGDRASAARYIECRLTPLAKEILFNKDLTEFVESYDGRMLEPVTLPAKIPLLMLMGAEGIAVGMATKILPHNFCELLEAQKKILKGESFTLFPDFPQKGLIDITNYDDGNGKIRCRAHIEEANEKTVV
ncbi:MAG: DNA gyrase subunit A, partial [Desulforhopalus sp.]